MKVKTSILIWISFSKKVKLPFLIQFDKKASKPATSYFNQSASVYTYIMLFQMPSRNSGFVRNLINSSVYTEWPDTIYLHVGFVCSFWCSVEFVCYAFLIAQVLSL